MPNLVRSRGYGQVKPPLGARIDSGHPLAVGLGGAWLANVGAGRMIPDLVATNDLRAPTTDVSVWMGDGVRIGPAAGVKSGYTSKAATSSVRPTGSGVVGCSWMWRGVLLGSADANGEVFLLTYDNANGAPFGVWGYFRSGASSFDLEFNSGGGFQGVSVDASAPTLRPVTYITSWTFGVEIDTYRDGVQIHSRSTNVAAPTASATAAVLLGGGVTQARNPNSISSLGYFWNRPLVRSEVTQLVAEPYAFIAPPGPKTLYLPLYVAATTTPINDGDTGTATDAGESIAAAITDTDTGTATDAGESIAAAIVDADTATIADAGETIAVTLADGDTATALDDMTITVLLADSDAATAVDTELLAVAITDADTAVVAEAEAIVAAILDTELATAADLLVVDTGIRRDIDYRVADAPIAWRSGDVDTAWEAADVPTVWKAGDA